MEAGDYKVALGREWWSVKISRASVDRILWVFLAVNVALMAYYICRGYRSDFHSDSAIKNLLAQEMFETGSYFPPDWNYVNGDLWIVFGQAFVLPLIPWAKNGFMLHAFSGLISAGLILLGVWLVMSLFVESRWIRRIALITFAGGISALGAENLYGQVSYGSVLYMACFTLYLSWRYLEAPPRAEIRWAIGLPQFCILRSMERMVYWSMLIARMLFSSTKVLKIEMACFSLCSLLRKARYFCVCFQKSMFSREHSLIQNCEKYFRIEGSCNVCLKVTSTPSAGVLEESVLQLADEATLTAEREVFIVVEIDLEVSCMGAG